MTTQATPEKRPRPPAASRKQSSAIASMRGAVNLRNSSTPNNPAHRVSGAAGHLKPRAEDGIAGGTMVTGRKKITTKLKKLVDQAVAEQERLCMASGLEVFHVPCSSSCRLVRRLRTVVEIATLRCSTPGRIARFAEA
jgi:hypothetical protein